MQERRGFDRNRGGSKRGGFRRREGDSDGAQRFGRNFGEREMHQATCAECGAACEVPFKPTAGRPVFCRDCYKKRAPRF